MSRRYVLIAATFAVAREVRATAGALAAVDPEVPRTIVVVDGDERSVALLEGAGELCTGADLGISVDEVGRWIGAYGEEGAMWASFPHVVAAVGEPGERVLWIGGDIHVAAAPEALWAELEDAEVLGGLAAPSLAPHGNDRPDSANGQPHSLQPVSAVAHRNGELVTRSLLGWKVDGATLTTVLADWPVPRDRPTHECLACGGVAQLWFNMLALRPEVRLARSSGAVLSIAQLLAREVTVGESPEEVLINGEPLALLTLHGFDPEKPHLFEGRVVTARVSERPALAGTLRDRAETLLKAGWEDTPPESPWQALPQGLPLSQVVRDLVRAGLRAGVIERSPFSPEGFAQLKAYACAPARQGGSIGVNRLLAAVYASRPDLHAAYPSLDGPDGLGFLGWAWVYGRDELSIPESFLPPRPAFLDAAPAASVAPTEPIPDTPGVNLAGYFTSELGLGESARQIAAALGAAGVATTPVQGLLVPPTRQQAEFRPVGPQDAHHDVNVVVVNGDQMPMFAKDVGPGFFEGRPTVAVWWWEVDPFPVEEWGRAMAWIDEIWVGTDFIRGLIEPHVDVPVWVFPVPVSVSRLETPIDRGHFGFDEDETLFLYVWDYHSTEARKNPSGLVEAYKRAFPEGSDSKTRLVLKCINHENLPEADEKVRLAAAGRDDITFIDRFLSGREKNGLLEVCDCYVSPHRSEGFGYTPAEAMLLGKPVVVTGYGGTTEYTDPDVARMVAWTPAKVGRGALPYPPDGIWADPDLDDLAAHLVWVVEQPVDAAAMAERGRARVLANHGLTTAGDAMRDRLVMIRARHAAGGGSAERNTPATGASATTAAPGSSTTARLRRMLKALPGTSRARRVWWRMQDRSVASRTIDLRHQVAEVRAATDSVRELNISTFDKLIADRESMSQGLEERFIHITERLDEATRRDHEILSELRKHEASHSVEPYGLVEAGFSLLNVDGIGRALGASSLTPGDDQYADFLAVFRGPYERVLALMEPYGPLLKGHGPLLDVGCGRGELLEIAERAGIEALGVDLDLELVRQATERGRTARAGDGITALRDAADASLGAVSAIHVIEHLAVEDLEAFFREAHRALRPGGLLLTETINPHEVTAASTFWVDPTHRGPVFPEVALALASSAGYSSAYIFAPDGSGDWEVDRTRSTRYALAARR